MAFRKLPEQQILLKMFAYDRETGEVFRHSSGRVITSRQRRGYIIVCINTRAHLLHRVIWKMMTGEDPGTMDHIDGIRDNNRWGNLRSVTLRENSRNMRRPSTNTSGVVGVGWNRRLGKWVVQIGETRDGVRLSAHVGCFHSFDDAVGARKRAELERGFHPNCGSEPVFKYYNGPSARARRPDR